ncbi:hypothetical protein DICVIV_03211 [Dictyocaulus viviparus]|uniref:Uncharacterized protein n=1 Tax=Dictyocaulus viviparus TaxID=29172 RepID=A0A0D8Y3L8_DICVI|nr:hypothetical protein DICVIV_03211 [Dictyocaulus viviparus]
MIFPLGSSAPEILLSVIEIFGNNFEAGELTFMHNNSSAPNDKIRSDMCFIRGELGPSTIVGSAAFNLFVIIAVCIYVDKVAKILLVIATQSSSPWLSIEFSTNKAEAFMHL